MYNWFAHTKIIIFLSRLHRKFGFLLQLKRWKVTFFRPVGGKVKNANSAGRKSGNPDKYIYPSYYIKIKIIMHF
jgi:hypothetical protein